MITKSKEMLDIERTAGKSIDEVLIETFDRHSDVAATAKALGVSYATMLRWIDVCGLRIVVGRRLERTGEALMDETEVVGGSPVVLE